MVMKAMYLLNISFRCKFFHQIGNFMKPKFNWKPIQGKVN